MPFVPKPTKKKVEAAYKTLYLTKELIARIEKVAEKTGQALTM